VKNGALKSSRAKESLGKIKNKLKDNLNALYLIYLIGTIQKNSLDNKFKLDNRLLTIAMTEISCT